MDGQAAVGETAAASEIPPYFLCPISLQLMRDPVTLPTGITYDRDSIEEWLFSSATCPVTNLPLPDRLHLIPNATLRSLICSWCATHPSVPLPSAAPDPSLLLREAPRHLPSLRELRDMVSTSDRARRSLERAGAAPTVLRILLDPSSSATYREEALAVLHSLHLSDESLRRLLRQDRDATIRALTRELSESTQPARTHAASLLRVVVHATGAAGLEEEVFAALSRVITDGVSYRATKAALRVLREALPVGRNRVRGAETGAVGAVVELLLDGQENHVVELAMVVLEILCGCAEGREALVGHAAGLPIVTAMVGGVSEAATERAVRVLWWVSRHASAKVVEEMAQVGAVAKLCHHTIRGGKIAEKAREAVGMHAREWRSSPCVPAGVINQVDSDSRRRTRNNI